MEGVLREQAGVLGEEQEDQPHAQHVQGVLGLLGVGVDVLLAQQVVELADQGAGVQGDLGFAALAFALGVHKEVQLV